MAKFVNSMDATTSAWSYALRIVVLIAVLTALQTAGQLAAQTGSALPPAQTVPDDLAGVRPPPISRDTSFPDGGVDREEILELLRKGRFPELDQLFETLETRVGEDIRWEGELLAAYGAFFGSDTTMGPRLDEWADRADPRSDAPLVARAQFFRARAWGVRGKGLIAEVDSVRIRRMDGFIQSGIDDISAAARLDPENLCVYTTALGLTHLYGWSPDGEEWLKKALSNFPASHSVRYQALKTMTPRWGGSYGRMQRLIQEAQSHVSSNPSLETMEGAIALDQARELWLERRYAEALAKTEEARALGTGWDLHYQRGRIYYSASDFVRALAEFDSAVALNPASADVLDYRGRTLYRIARLVYPEERRAGLLRHAELDLQEAVAFQQPDSAVANWLEWTSWRKRRCEVSPTYCFEEGGSALSDPEVGWKRGVLFLLSIPFTLFYVLLEGNQLYLLPAPFVAGASLLWNLPEWRRQRYSVPRIVHIMSALCFLTLVLINVDWVLAGGTMWTQRYVVIAVSTLLPYTIYLVVGGPRHMAKRKLPGGK